MLQKYSQCIHLQQGTTYFFRAKRRGFVQRIRALRCGGIQGSNVE
jgi:hypothetical protein